MDKNDKVSFILKLYDDEFTTQDKENILQLSDLVIDPTYNYFQDVITHDKRNTGNPELPDAKENIKKQLLVLIKIYYTVNQIFDGVWEKLKVCINRHKEESIKLLLQKLNRNETRRNSSFFRTDWINCCPDDLKEIAKKLAKEINAEETLTDDVITITRNVHIACSVVISYYLIQLEWESFRLSTLHITGPSEWIIPKEWTQRKKNVSIIPITVMCWVNEKFGIDQQTKNQMVNKINKFIVGIATKGSYDNIDLSKYHNMIVNSGEFVQIDSVERLDISPAVQVAMLNDAQMAEQMKSQSAGGGKRNRSTHRRNRVSKQHYIIKHKRTKSSKHKRNI
jgi:hypothetical protein